MYSQPTAGSRLMYTKRRETLRGRVGEGGGLGGTLYSVQTIRRGDLPVEWGSLAHQKLTMYVSPRRQKWCHIWQIQL